MAKVVDLSIDQDSHFSYTFLVTENGVPKVLTGWTARMQIRADRRSTDQLLSELTSSPSAGLAIVAAAGQILLDIDASETAGFDWDAGEYDLCIFDPVSTPPGEPYRIFQGKIRVNHNVLV